jgi:peptidoglycan/LPS O-acetylase OafA/YrhL
VEAGQVRQRWHDWRLRGGAPRSAITDMPTEHLVGPRHGVELPHVPALDGVRGVAVALVVAYHLGVPVAPGGFLGVDLFFVLSGFLITTLLLRELASTARIDLVRFWLRRARRLLPALFILVAVVALWARVSSPFERAGLRWDLLATLGYVANWRFILTGQSYFQQFGSPSPMRHLWSLAIEEQFYVAWPVLVLGGLTLAQRARAAAAWIVPALLVVVIATSALLLALLYNEADPSAAYYNTLTRAHELLIGAATAGLIVARPVVSAFVKRWSDVIAGVTLAAILTSAGLLLDSSSAYYFGGSLLFSVAASALVAAVMVGGDESGSVMRVLALRPLVALGVISYGVYLWHWPMIVWLTPVTTGLDGLALTLLRVAATLGAAGVSFVVVERPIRRGSIRGFRMGARPVFIGAAGCAAMLALVSILTTRGATALPGFVSNNRELIRYIVPGARGSIGLVGDSVAMSLYPGIANEAAKRDLSTVAATFPGCSSGTAERLDGNGKPFSWGATCSPAIRSGQRAMVAVDHVTTVFWLNRSDGFDIRTAEGTLKAWTPAWERVLFADWDESLSRLTSRGADVVVLLPLKGPSETRTACAAGQGLASGTCEGALASKDLGTEYRRWASRHPDTVRVVDVNDDLCPGETLCPRVLNGVNLRVDGVHLTEKGALLVASLIARLDPSVFP